MDCNDSAATTDSTGKARPDDSSRKSLNEADLPVVQDCKESNSNDECLHFSSKESLLDKSRVKKFFDVSDSPVPPNPESLLNTTFLNFDYRSDDKDMLSRIATELIISRDPNLTKETLVLRALQRISEGTFNLSWLRVLDTLRQGQCRFDRESHNLLDRALELCTHQHDEAIDRIASRDYVKKSDVDRLATLLGASSFEKNVPVCVLFAVDGFYEFHDLKLYGNHFKCCDDYKTRHVAAVRKLYQWRKLDAAGVLRVVEWAFAEDGSAPNEPHEIEAVSFYKATILPENLTAVRVWKTKERRQVRENLERAKRAAEKKSRVEALKTEFASSDRDSNDTVTEKKRKREEKKRQRSAESEKKRKVEEKKTKRKAKHERREEEKIKYEQREEIVRLSDSSSDDSRDREDVLKTLTEKNRNEKQTLDAQQRNTGWPNDWPTKSSD